MGIVSETLERRVLVEGYDGRRWVCRQLDRADWWTLNLLQAALRIARAEAAEAAGLLHLPPEHREVVQAQNDAERETRAPNAARMVEEHDRLAAHAVEACIYGDQEHPVRLVLERAEADDRATPERIWVGALPLGELAAIANALLAVWRGEVRDGVTFRSAQPRAAGPG